MPRFKQLPEILKLMHEKERIRNLGIVAHIDHGKTTLTDSLLAGAGLLSPSVAGSARVLDYLEEEQKRGITMKAANISLQYKTSSGSFVVNLVDTPGHVDFTGKVTRALRAVDGAVVVVDAVEEVMAQTEIVTRQALEERVRPVLFINKVDRLISELRLNGEAVEEKFSRIIARFNDLIDVYAEPAFKREWKVDPAKDSVAFGSALHRWAFTLSIASQKDVKFGDIMRAYDRGELDGFRKVLPLHDAVLDMIVKNVPSPLRAQGYRVARIWKGDVSSKVGKAMASCDDSGPAVMCVTNVQVDPEAGVIATGRLFSGTVKNGSKVYLVNAQVEDVVEQVSVFMGAFREPVDEVSAGNIAALAGLMSARAGETVVGTEHGEGMVPFELVRYVSEPVVSVAVEPKNPADLPILLEAIRKVVMEDPNLATEVNRETGEYLLSGMGELHLEVALKRLKEYTKGIAIAVSSPRVAYRETVTKKGKVAVAKSPNKQNVFKVRVEPLDEQAAGLIEREAGERALKNILAVDEHRNVLLDSTRRVSVLGDVAEHVVSGFRFACAAGPLCGEPLRHVKVNLLEWQVSENPEHRGPVEIMRGVGKAVFGSILTAKPVLLEPIYKMIISVPAELAGECSRILGSRRGQVQGFEQKGALAFISGCVPVAEAFGLSEALRSATSGRAFWQLLFDRWERVPERLAGETIRAIRGRKGLALEVPKPEQFTEADA